MKGFFVQNRHHLATLARWFKTPTKLLQGLVWAWWYTYGWRLVAAALILFVGVMGGTVAVFFASVIPFGFVWAVISTVVVRPADSRNAAIFATLFLMALVVGVIWVRHKYEQPYATYAKASLAVGYGGMSFWYTISVIGWVAFFVLLFTIPLAWSIDMIAGTINRKYRLERAYAEFRREWKQHWTDLAARSGRIQSFDQAIERTVSQIAEGRPILEHLAFGSVRDTVYLVDEFAVMLPVARPEGRSFDALQEVLDEWAAQFFSISNSDRSVRLVYPEGMNSNYTSWAYARIEFADTGAFSWPWSKGREPVPVDGDESVFGGLSLVDSGVEPEDGAWPAAS